MGLKVNINLLKSALEGDVRSVAGQYQLVKRTPEAKAVLTWLDSFMVDKTNEIGFKWDSSKRGYQPETILWNEIPTEHHRAITNLNIERFTIQKDNTMGVPAVFVNNGVELTNSGLENLKLFERYREDLLGYLNDEMKPEAREKFVNSMEQNVNLAFLAVMLRSDLGKHVDLDDLLGPDLATDIFEKQKSFNEAKIIHFPEKNALNHACDLAIEKFGEKLKEGKYEDICIANNYILKENKSILSKTYQNITNSIPHLTWYLDSFTEPLKIKLVESIKSQNMVKALKIIKSLDSLGFEPKSYLPSDKIDRKSFFCNTVARVLGIENPKSMLLKSRIEDLNSKIEQYRQKFMFSIKSKINTLNNKYADGKCLQEFFDFYTQNGLNISQYLHPGVSDPLGMLYNLIPEYEYDEPFCSSESWRELNDKYAADICDDIDQRRQLEHRLRLCSQLGNRFDILLSKIALDEDQEEIETYAYQNLELWPCDIKSILEA